MHAAWGQVLEVVDMSWNSQDLGDLLKYTGCLSVSWQGVVVVCSFLLLALLSPTVRQLFFITEFLPVNDGSWY